MTAKNEQSVLNMDDFVLDPNVKRHIHLDMLRVIAIFGVVVDHGNPDSKQYGIHNVMFTQNWCLQLLWVTCGISWALTKSTLGPYVLRLCVYLIIGVSFNWMAWISRGMDWRHDLQGVVYQFAFIVGLIVYVSCTAWLKPSLVRIYASRIDIVDTGNSHGGNSEPTSSGVATRASHESLIEEATGHEGSNWTSIAARNATPALSGVDSGELDEEERKKVKMFGVVVVALVLGMLALSFVFSHYETVVVKGIINLLLGQSARMWTQDLDDRAFFGQFIGTFGAYFLIVVGSKLLQSPRLAPWLLWVVIVYIYSCRILLLPLLFDQYGGGVGRFFVGLELFLMGLVGNTAGLKHAGALKRWIADYFILILIFVAITWGPTWERRMDEHPPGDMNILARVQICELVFLVSFLAAGSLMFPEEGWSSRVRSWLAETATVLFLIHKATHIAVPVPYNWYIVFLLVPGAFWFRHFGRSRRPGQRTVNNAELPTSGGGGAR